MIQKKPVELFRTTGFFYGLKLSCFNIDNKN